MPPPNLERPRRQNLLGIGSGLGLAFLIAASSKPHPGQEVALSSKDVRPYIVDTRRGGAVYDGTHNVENFGIPRELRGKISPDCAILPRKDCLPSGISEEWRHGDPVVREPLTGGQADKVREREWNHVAWRREKTASRQHALAVAVSPSPSADGVPPAIMAAFQRANLKWEERHPQPTGKQKSIDGAHHSQRSIDGAHHSGSAATDRANVEGISYGPTRGSSSSSSSSSSKKTEQMSRASSSVMTTIDASQVPPAVMKAFARLREASRGNKDKSKLVRGNERVAEADAETVSTTAGSGGKLVISSSMLHHLEALKHTLQGEIGEIRRLLSAKPKA
jgi:hypothetical protein